MLNFNVASLEIEECVDRVRGGFDFGLRLVGGAVVIGNDVNLRLHNFEVAEENARAPEIEDVDGNVDGVDLGIGYFALRLAAVEGKSVDVHFELQKVPAKRANLRATARCGVNASDEAFADDVLETRRGGPKVQPD